MNKATLMILYAAALLTILAPTIERVRTVILPGMARATAALQAVAK